jgi:hypothetical protein
MVLKLVITPHLKSFFLIKKWLNDSKVITPPSNFIELIENEDELEK